MIAVQNHDFDWCLEYISCWNLARQKLFSQPGCWWSTSLTGLELHGELQERRRQIKWIRLISIKIKFVPHQQHTIFIISVMSWCLLWRIIQQSCNINKSQSFHVSLEAGRFQRSLTRSGTKACGGEERTTFIQTMLTLCCNLHDLQRSNMTKTKTWKHDSEWFHWNFTKRLCMSSRFRSKRHLCPWSFKIWRLSKKKIHRFLQTFEMTGVSFLPRSIHDWAPSPSWIGCVKSCRLVPKGASAPRCRRELGWSKLFLGNWLKEWKCDWIEFVFFIAFSIFLNASRLKSGKTLINEMIKTYQYCQNQIVLANLWPPRVARHKLWMISTRFQVHFGVLDTVLVLLEHFNEACDPNCCYAATQWQKLMKSSVKVKHLALIYSRFTNHSSFIDLDWLKSCQFERHFFSCQNLRTWMTPIHPRCSGHEMCNS